MNEMFRFGVLLLCLVMMSRAALLVKREAPGGSLVKRDVRGGSSSTKFVPSQPLPPHDELLVEEDIQSSEMAMGREEAKIISARSSNSKDADKEDTKGSMYYYYYPSGNSASEDRDGGASVSAGAGGLSAYDPIDAAASGSSSTGSSFGGGGYGASPGVSTGGYGGAVAVSAGKDTSHFIKIAIPLFIIGSILLGMSSLAYGSYRSLDSRPFSFMQKWEQVLQKQFDVYLSALEAEECLQRTVCEAGHYAKEYSATKYVLPLFEIFAPKTMINNMKIFKTAIQDKRNMKSCKKYKCNNDNILQKKKL